MRYSMTKKQFEHLKTMILGDEQQAGLVEIQEVLERYQEKIRQQRNRIESLERKKRDLNNKIEFLSKQKNGYSDEELLAKIEELKTENERLRKLGQNLLFKYKYKSQHRV